MTLSRRLPLALLLPSVAIGQAPDTSRWECKLCPFEQRSEATAELGALYVTDSAAGFGDATGLNEQGAYPLANAQGTQHVESHVLQWALTDLGLDTRSLELAAARPGHYQVKIAYSELPHRMSDTTRTPYSSTHGMLTLPSTWMQAGSTAGMTGLNGALKERDLQTKREATSLDARYRALDAVELFTRYRHETREGTSLLAGAFVTQSTQLPQPIDERTEQLEVGARYRHVNGYAQLAYYGSFYRNANELLIWDNPFTPIVPGATQGALALSPDNQFHQLAAAGSYRFGTRTVLTVNASAGRMRQSTPLAPYTLNADLSSPPLPSADLNGEVSTSTLQAAVTHRLHRTLRVQANYRYEDRDNRTSEREWTRIVSDSFTTDVRERNPTYDFTHSKFSLNGEWEMMRRPSWWTTLESRYEYHEQRRTQQAVGRQTERTGFSRLRFRTQDGLDLSVRGGTAKREVDDYGPSDANENSLLRKYHLAYRYREFADARLSAPIGDAPITVSGAALYARDSYTLSLLGLQHSTERNFSGDVQWSPTDAYSLYAHAAYQHLTAAQRGSESFATADWEAGHDDRFVAFGGGARVAVNERLDLDLNVTRTDGEGQQRRVTASVLPQSFSAVTSRMTGAELRGRYRWTESLTALLHVRYEHVRNADWALDGVAPDTVPSLLALGMQPHNYSAAAIGLSLQYRHR